MGQLTIEIIIVRRAMEKNTKAAATTPGHKGSPPGASATSRVMSLEKAKKLIRKTSDEHKSLFRRLAK